jgi:hypothetical protein
MFAAKNTRNTTGSDPYWSSVSLLTNFENNLSFQDGSTNNFAITRNGTVNPNLNTPFSGVGGSEKFDGSTGYLTIATNAAFTYGTGDFTIECWVYINSTGTAQYIIDQRNSGTATAIIPTIYISTTATLRYYVNGADRITGTTTLSISTWYQVVVARSSTSTKMFLNGTQEGSTYTDSNNYAASRVVIGSAADAAGSYLNGFVSNARLVKGTAVYTANFTPPTVPLTAITNTSLLITGTGQGMFDNSTFLDQGPNTLTLTPTGSPLYSGRSPFGNTNFGSVQFNGSSQYFSVSNNAALQFGSGAATIEFWIYPTSVTGIRQIINTAGTGGSVNLSYAVITSGTACLYYLSSTGTTWNIASAVSVGTVALNTWYHVAIVRSGNVWTPYLNGVAGTATTNAAALYNFTTPVLIAQNNTAGYFSGNISNMRLVKGTAVYTAAFTPPTAPLTAITNTSLLIRGDTGAFYDLSNNGNPESNTGTTAVTTQIKKYGNESGSYTATAYQTATDATNLQFGSGDYTIEMWAYRNAAGILHSLICKGAATTGWLLQINALNQLTFTVGTTALLTSTTTISATTWTFLTVTRSGTSTRLFIGGNLEATATDSTNFNQTTGLLIGADRSSLNGLNGYLDDIRLTKGVARYTATFTPPATTFPTGP